MADSSRIPILDATALLTGDPVGMDALVEDFGRAYRDVGFSYIVNHGIDAQLIDEVFEASRQFHALGLDQKMAIELNSDNRGFLPMDATMDINTKLAEVTKPNRSESFLMMCECAPDSPEVLAGDYLAGPNVWPDLAGFRETVTAYHDAMCWLGRKMMGIAARAIGADPEVMVDHFASPVASVRLLHYPPLPPGSPDDLYGSAPHCDFGCLTLLAQDDVGGLQVRPVGDGWIDVPNIPGSFVVNVGDMLRLWSNGQLLSTPHRVTNSSRSSRFSIPFFFDPHVSTVIAPLRSCVTPERPVVADAVVWGDHLRSELEAGFEPHKMFTAEHPPESSI